MNPSKFAASLPVSLRTVGRGAGLAALLLMLAGCVTGGYGAGYPDQAGYPGQSGYPGQPYPGQPYPDDRGGTQALTGTVEGIDLNGQRLVLMAQASRYAGGSRVDVYFDRNTRLVYQGRVQAIEGLERGDVVRVDAVQSGGRLWARSIEVVQDVRDQRGGNQYGDQYGNELRGAIGYVDARSRLIGLERGGYGGAVRVRYDERTVVEYQGRRYSPQDLERGDEVRVQARDAGGGEWLAERIWVERSVRGR